jgi:hypothetical protein
MAAGVMEHLSSQMKTDAYTECRGVGRITVNDRPADHPGQAMNADAAIAGQENFSC